MKNFFLQLFYAVAATATGGAVTPLTSPKLDELKASYRVAYKDMMKFDDPFSDEAKAAKMAAWKIEGEIKAEEAALLKAVNDAKIAEARNVRLALNANQLSSYATLIALQGDKKADPAKVVEAQAAFDTAKELVDNELLAKYAATKIAKPKSDGDTNEAKGGKSEQKAAILGLYKDGKKHAEIEAEGYAKSTVWHVINNAIKSGEVEKLH